MLHRDALGHPRRQAAVLHHLVQMLTSPERLAAMSAAALTQAHPLAAETIANRIVSLAR